MRERSKIVLVGKAAAGKDYLRSRYEDKGFKFGVSYTTRPPRKKANEQEGVDYYFVSEYEFIEMIGQDKFVEYQKFNGWFYGITKEEFERCDIMILNAEAVDLLSEEYRSRCFVNYIDISIDVRRSRIMERNDPDDDFERRIQADEDQFRNFSNFDCRITNHNF
jgi:guanylate kinase|tara:strand:- start:5541 stop:6032 length:492 start_codon:yes stop_codon:yes gene_type:complete